ncbi:hypothetical protein [Microbulbifer sp. SSSA005]|uniref:hypothetical protein n=1 Tax=Microbulbifer sp. SSSA005 TaxID=3243378 RepID=UPI0040391154
MDQQEKTFEELRQKTAQYAQAEAERVYLAEFRKSKKALLMKDAERAKPGLSAAAQEREAYAHPEYVELLEGLRYATEVALKLRMGIKVTETKIEVWRTKQANVRAEMNLR